MSKIFKKHTSEMTFDKNEVVEEYFIKFSKEELIENILRNGFPIDYITIKQINYNGKTIAFNSPVSLNINIDEKGLIKIFSSALKISGCGYTFKKAMTDFKETLFNAYQLIVSDRQASERSKPLVEFIKSNTKYINYVNGSATDTDIDDAIDKIILRHPKLWEKLAK